MKRTRLRKKGKSARAKLIEKIWSECRRIIRARYPHVCYTCGATGLYGSNLHTGHGKPNAALSLKFKYDLRNLRPQCMHCNNNLGGVSDIFISKLEKEKEGLAFLKESCIKVDGHWEIKYVEPMGTMESDEFLNNLLFEYKKIKR